MVQLGRAHVRWGTMYRLAAHHPGGGSGGGRDAAEMMADDVPPPSLPRASPLSL